MGYEITNKKIGSDFPKELHAPNYLTLLIQNKGDFPATNVEVETSYSLKKVTYETKFDEIIFIKKRLKLILVYIIITKEVSQFLHN